MPAVVPPCLSIKDQSVLVSASAGWDTEHRRNGGIAEERQNEEGRTDRKEEWRKNERQRERVCQPSGLYKQ